MNRYLLILGIIIILLNVNLNFNKKTLYLVLFMLSMKYLTNNKIDNIEKSFFIDIKTRQMIFKEWSLDESDLEKGAYGLKYHRRKT